MKTRYAYSICVWKPNERWPDQLELKPGSVHLEQTMSDVWNERRSLDRSFGNESLTIMVDLLDEKGPRVVGIYGWVPYKYIDEVMILERQVLSVKEKIVGYVINASLSEALKTE